MTRRRGQIGIADALTVARTLHLKSIEDLALVMDLLGLRDFLEDSEVSPRSAHGELIRKSPVSTGQSSDHGEALPDTDQVAVKTLADPLPPDPVAPITFEQVESLVPGAPGGGSVGYEPIVPLHQLRAAMTMIVRRPRRSIHLDIEAAVEEIAQQRPMDEVPRLIEQTVDGGVTIIADIGPDMLPYLDDVSHLVQAAKLVVGAPTTTVLWIEDCDDLPSLSTERPIVIISTCGATQSPASPPGAAARWKKLIRMLVLADADATAVVPHRRSSPDPSSRIHEVAWDDLAEVGRGRI